MLSSSVPLPDDDSDSNLVEDSLTPSSCPSSTWPSSETFHSEKSPLLNLPEVLRRIRAAPHNWTTTVIDDVEHYAPPDRQPPIPPFPLPAKYPPNTGKVLLTLCGWSKGRKTGMRLNDSFLAGGLAWLGLAWLGLAWLGLAWLGLAWLGLAWLTLISHRRSILTSLEPSLFSSLPSPPKLAFLPAPS